MRAASISIAVIAGVAGVVALTLLYGSRRGKRATEEIHARLEEARVPGARTRYRINDLDGLPVPVQRYFRAVLKDGQRMITAVRLEQSGTMNMSETGENWKRFTATQRVVTGRPGFDWESRIEMGPGMAVRVHDAYIAGEGMLRATLFGLVPLANLRGPGEIARGELMRFLAEAAWYPTALLPSQGVRWEAQDESSAEATLTDGEIAVTLLFRFDERGLIESVRAEGRGRTVAGAMVLTPWEGRWKDYELRHELRIPVAGEVAWMLPEGPKTYWRGRVTRIAYEFAE